MTTITISCLPATPSAAVVDVTKKGEGTRFVYLKKIVQSIVGLVGFLFKSVFVSLPKSIRRWDAKYISSSLGGILNTTLEIFKNIYLLLPSIMNGHLLPTFADPKPLWKEDHYGTLLLNQLVNPSPVIYEPVNVKEISVTDSLLEAHSNGYGRLDQNVLDLYREKQRSTSKDLDFEATPEPEVTGLFGQSSDPSPSSSDEDD
jgi:hypothetical protein